jgi:hypothetical protein
MEKERGRGEGIRPKLGKEEGRGIEPAVEGVTGGPVRERKGRKEGETEK